jgi:hypothetical protein
MTQPPTERVNTPPTGVTSAPLYLRVARVGDEWTYSYSPDGTNWQVATTFDYAMSVTAVGLITGNWPGSSSPAFTSQIDYFRNLEASSPSGESLEFSGLAATAAPTELQFEPRNAPTRVSQPSLSAVPFAVLATSADYVDPESYVAAAFAELDLRLFKSGDLRGGYGRLNASPSPRLPLYRDLYFARPYSNQDEREPGTLDPDSIDAILTVDIDGDGLPDTVDGLSLRRATDFP